MMPELAESPVAARVIRAMSPAGVATKMSP
jgi:hypothetical protein